MQNEINPKEKPKFNLDLASIVQRSKDIKYFKFMKHIDLSVLARALPFMAYVAVMAVTDLIDQYGNSAWDLRWMYVIKISVVGVLLFMFRTAYGELAYFRRIKVHHLMQACVISGVVFVAWINLDAGWMKLGATTGFNPASSGSVDWLWVAVRLVGAVLVVPLMEELFWRSLLLRWLTDDTFQAVDPARVSGYAFWIVALLFGFEHNLWLAGMVAALAFNFLYMHTRNLWIPIFAHAVTNALLGVWVIWSGHWEFW